MKPEDIRRFNEFIGKLQGKQKQAEEYQYMSLCPGHDDTKHSLWSKLNENGVIGLDCKAGCPASKIVKAMGYKNMEILSGIPQVIATLEYVNLKGELVCQELKYDKSSLNKNSIQQPTGKPPPNDWYKSTKGMIRVIFNIFDVVRSGKDEIVFMCEGGTDATTLKHKGLIATAVILNDWIKTDTTLLDGRIVVILVDNDEGGEIIALKAAHDRFGKSKRVGLLRLPDLKPGGDVTDWLKGKTVSTKCHTVEELLTLAGKVDDWYPQRSVRDCVEAGKETGQSFEHNDPGPIFEAYYDIFHPRTEGPLDFWDRMWLKGNMKTLLMEQICINVDLKEPMSKWLKLCFNKKGKEDELFKPQPEDFNKILQMGEIDLDLNVLKNPIMPIFNPFYMDEKIKNYERKDIIIMKKENFYVPERCPFPRNMEACKAMDCLPFDYDPKAKCPEIDKALFVQWPKDLESIDMLLQFISYYMTTSFLYKAILCAIGESNSGKSMIVELIRHFIGYNSCPSLSVRLIGDRFELWRALYAKILIADDTTITPRDLQNGGIIENLKSIPSGIPVRLERKNDPDVLTRQLPCQILIAANYPPEIREFSNALSNRFKFLFFPHVFLPGVDMIGDILDKWKTEEELAGLFIKVLDAGLVLKENGRFIEPKSSAATREKFEGSSNPVWNFVRESFDVNSLTEKIKWMTTIASVTILYNNYSEKTKEKMFSTQKFNRAMEGISGIKRGDTKINVINEKTGETKRVSIKVWIGLRQKGTSGVITVKDVGDSPKVVENEPKDASRPSEGDAF